MKWVQLEEGTIINWEEVRWIALLWEELEGATILIFLKGREAPVHLCELGPTITGYFPSNLKSTTVKLDCCSALVFMETLIEEIESTPLAVVRWGFLYRRAARSFLQIREEKTL